MLADDLAHPLLPRDQRVGNGVSLNTSDVMLLTGANASGKSTYLRTCCLSWLLARVGCPSALQKRANYSRWN